MLRFIQTDHRYHRLIIVYPILLQLITGMFLLAYDGELRVASLGIFYQLFPIPKVGSLIMLGVVLIALLGMFRERDKFRFLYFIPQYLFLLFTAGSGMSYVIMGRYADGVIRPWQFIFIDQLPSFIIVVLYTLAIFDFVKKEYDPETIG